MCFLLARSVRFSLQLKLVFGGVGKSFIRIPRLHYRLSIVDDLLDAHQCLGGKKSRLQSHGGFETGTGKDHRTKGTDLG